MELKIETQHEELCVEICKSKALPHNKTQRMCYRCTRMLRRFKKCDQIRKLSRRTFWNSTQNSRRKVTVLSESQNLLRQFLSLKSLCYIRRARKSSTKLYKQGPSGVVLMKSSFTAALVRNCRVSRKTPPPILLSRCCSACGVHRCIMAC